jgi:tetratricopeptide (TPR) repeat protein
MTKRPRASLAIRHNRMLLIRGGLSEDEADAFLDRLADEFAAGRPRDQNAQLRFIERELADVKKAQLEAPGRIELAITAVVTGVASSWLYELSKSQLGTEELAPARSVDQDSEDAIRIEWAGIKPPEITLQFLPYVEKALQRRSSRRGALDKQAAIYLDAIGIFLDAQGATTERQNGCGGRSSRFPDEQNGPDHQSTGAALSNLGLCLFAQSKYAESNDCLTDAVRILRKSLGEQNAATAAALYNCYISFNAQGRFRNVSVPAEFLRAIGQFEELAVSEMAGKAIIVNLLALADIAKGLTDQIAANRRQ